MSIAAQAAEPESVSAQLAMPLGPRPSSMLQPVTFNDEHADARPAPVDPAAVAMYTAHRLDDTARHLAHAGARLGAAQDASGDLRSHHLGHCAHHLDGALASAHDLAANLRAHYPAEGGELDRLTQVIGLAAAVSPDAKTATTAHLTQTVCNHLGHTIRHVAAMGEDPDPDVQEFNLKHGRKHLSEAVEHAGKLRAHLADNYPREAAHLGGLDNLIAGAEDGGGIAAQMAVAHVAGRPKAGTISGQLDLAAWDPLKHPRDAHGRFVRKGAMVPGDMPWEHSRQRVRAGELRPGDFIGAYEVTGTEHGAAKGTTRVTFKGGARVTFRGNSAPMSVQRPSFGGESFFSKNKTLHYDDPAIKDLTSVYGDRLHIAADGKGWDTLAVQRHLRGLQEVPASHQRFIARSHVEIYVGTDPATGQDAMGYLSARHPPGYPQGDTWDQCGALFNSPEYDTTRKPEFGKTYNPPMTKPGKIVLGDKVGSGSVNTAAHETGHALDKFLGEDVFFRGAGALSQHPDFTAIHDRFAKGFEGADKDAAVPRWTGNPYYLQEGGRGASEFFAETYAAWVHTRDKPSAHRAEEIMDAVGMYPKTTRLTEEGGKTRIEETAAADRRRAVQIKRQIGADLIAFYDGLDARIKGTVSRLPPPRMKAGAQ